MTAPPPPTDRLIVLDATRGVAVMGILLMNIVSFAMPASAYIHPLAWGSAGPLDLGVWVVNQLLFEGRMRGLFALMFGASALLVMARAERAGERPVAVHLRRMTVLAAIGLAHMILVWDGDVLFHYAVIALLIWPLRDVPPHKLLAFGIILLGLHTLVWSALFLSQLATLHAAAAPGASADLVATARELLAATPGPGDASIAADLAVYRGGYAGMVAHRFADVPFLPVKFLMMMGPETLGYMLIGMALFRTGLFDGSWSDAQLRRLALRCYAVALPVLAATIAWEVGSGFDRTVVLGHFLGWSVPFRVISAVGHLALAVMLFQRARDAALTRRIAAVGRMALSNYLATSLVMTTIFYGYGLGLYGQVERAPLYLFVIAMWGAMLLWSRPWLARFRFGPAEWLWRSLARGRVQPLRGAAN